MSTPMFDPAQLLASLFKGGEAQAEKAEAEAAGKQAEVSATEPGAADPTAAFTAFANQMVDMQQQFIKQMSAFWTGMPGAEPPASAAADKDSDKRFAGEAWRNDPRFDIVRRSYLAYSDFLQKSVEAVPLDAQTKAQMQFGMRQFVDAMSPSNFFATNPEAMQLAVETGGQSVAQGMNLFLEDLAKGRISTTDEKAYEIGRNIATTPGQVVFENELIQLIQYEPRPPRCTSVRCVMFPPAINKFYILDLQPENSLVRLSARAGAHGVHGVVAQHRSGAGPPDVGRLHRERDRSKPSRSRSKSAVRRR